jgi:hypothetical protein
MDAWHWIAVAMVAWLVLSCAVGAVFGLMVRRRDVQDAQARMEFQSSVDELEALFALGDAPFHR